MGWEAVVTVTLGPQDLHSTEHRALAHLGLHLGLQCVWRASLQERGGRPPLCPVPYGCLLGVVVVICAQGPDRCRQGSHAAPTMQLHRGAPRPGLSPGLVLPGSGPEGGQKGEKEAANVSCSVGSARQSALILTQARWGNRGSGPVTYPKPMWGTLWSPTPDGKMGGPPGWPPKLLVRVGAAVFPTLGGGGFAAGGESRNRERETGKEGHSHMTGRGAQRDRE